MKDQALLYTLGPNEQSRQLLARFGGGLYLESFPDTQEREDPALWTTRLMGEEPDSALGGTVALDRADEIVGAVLWEWYPKACCGLLTYIAVVETSRGSGLGASLFTRVAADIKALAAQGGRRLDALFGEVHDPRVHRSFESDTMAWKRLDWMQARGGRVLELPFLQPPVDGGEPLPMLLLAFPTQSDNPVARVATSTLVSFIEGIHRGSDPSCIASMIGSIRSAHCRTRKLRYQRQRMALPSLAVSLFWTVDRREDKLPRRCPIVASFEQDILDYPSRECPPMRTRVLGSRPATLVFPGSISYQAEGDQNEVLAIGADGVGTPRRLTISLHRAATTFRDGRVVHSTIFAPKEDVSDWDVIQLTMLGDSTDGRPFGDQVILECDGATSSLSSWAEKELGDGANILGQSVQIIVGTDPAWMDFMKHVFELHEDKAGAVSAFAVATEDEGDLMVMAQTISGILTSQWDFEETDGYELADSIGQTFSADPDCLCWAMLSTTLQISSADRAFSLPVIQHELGLSPYLLIPQAVALHNEQLLREAASLLEPAPSERELERVHTDLAVLLDIDWLDNPFHYTTERDYLAQAMSQRRCEQRRTLLRKQRALLGDRLKARGERRALYASVIMQTFLGLIAVVGLRELVFQLVPKEIAWPVFGLLALISALAIGVMAYRSSSASGAPGDPS